MNNFKQYARRMIDRYHKIGGKRQCRKFLAVAFTAQFNQEPRRIKVNREKIEFLEGC